MTMTPEEITRIKEILCHPSHSEIQRRLTALEDSLSKITDNLERKIDSLYRLGYTLLISIIATLITVVFSLIK